MRKEFKLGVMLFAIFNVVRFIAKDILTELPAIHFILGVIVGLALVHIMIGSLPEDKYLRIKAFKGNFSSFVK